ncbi:MAG: hypothetical protein K0Q50_1152 [Vampirovibrio sp.]|nr:hypothetical protein [Vampirovibrio sp.]
MGKEAKMPPQKVERLATSDTSTIMAADRTNLITANKPLFLPGEIESGVEFLTVDIGFRNHLIISSLGKC